MEKLVEKDVVHTIGKLFYWSSVEDIECDIGFPALNEVSFRLFLAFCDTVRSNGV